MKFEFRQNVKISGFDGQIVGTHEQPNGFGPIAKGEYAVRTSGGVTLRYADEIEAVQ